MVLIDNDESYESNEDNESNYDSETDEEFYESEILYNEILIENGGLPYYIVCDNASEYYYFITTVDLRTFMKRFNFKSIHNLHTFDMHKYFFNYMKIHSNNYPLCNNKEDWDHITSDMIRRLMEYSNIKSIIT